MIRPLGAADIEELVALWERCELTRPWNDPRRDIARKLEQEDGLLLVMKEEGVIRGSVMVGYDGHRGWVNYLAVDPGHRGRGLGRRLMEAAEGRLVELGCPKLNLQVRADNAAAVSFYRGLGYEVDDVVSLGRRLIAD